MTRLQVLSSTHQFSSTRQRLRRDALLQGLILGWVAGALSLALFLGLLGKC